MNFLSSVFAVALLSENLSFVLFNEIFINSFLNFKNKFDRLLNIFVLVPSCEVRCEGRGRRWRWRRLRARCSDCPGKGSWRSPRSPDTKIGY
jgi:hypothetical protein